jgi:hypothetical protein
MLLLLFSTLLYGVFVWFVVARPVRPWNLNRQPRPIARGVTALIAWPLIGFVLFWLGIFVVRIGEVMMLPAGVTLRLLWGS